MRLWVDLIHPRLRLPESRRVDGLHHCFHFPHNIHGYRWYKCPVPLYTIWLWGDGICRTAIKNRGGDWSGGKAISDE